MLTTLRTLATAPIHPPASLGRHLAMAGLCAWAGAFAHWFRYSGQALLPLLPTALVVGLLALAVTGGARRGGGAGRERSWELLSAGAGSLPPLALTVEFVAHALRSPSPTGPLLGAALLAGAALLPGWRAWRAARSGDWTVLGPAAFILTLLGGVSWLIFWVASLPPTEFPAGP